MSHESGIGNYVKTGNISGTAIAVGPNAKAESVSYVERRRPPAPRQAPLPPSYYLPRAEITRVMEGLANSGQHIIAISGPEGIGKTTLACAAVKDAEARFSGVLWWKFNGQPGESKEMIGSFLVALDMEMTQEATLDERLRDLRSALYDRSFLLVLDNLTVAGQDQEFELHDLLPQSGSSCVVLTTADRDLAATHTDFYVDVPPLSAEDARQLLVALVGAEINQIPEDLLAGVLRRVGGLPQAIVAIGRQARQVLRRGPDTLIAWFSNPNIDWSSLRSLYDLAWNRLDETERSVFRAIGMLAAAPVEAKLIGATLGMDRSEAQRRLESLEGLSLLDRRDDGSFQAHSSIRDYARGFLSNSTALTANALRALEALTGEIALGPVDDPHRQVAIDHLHALFDLGVETRDNEIINSIISSGLRLTTVSGSFRHSVLYRTSWFLGGLEADFRDTTIALCDLPGGQWNDCKLDEVLLSSVRLPGSQFNSCSFREVSMVDTDLRLAQFNACNFADLRLVRCDLRGAQFNDCTLSNYQFIDLETDDTTQLNAHSAETPLPVSGDPGAEIGSDGEEHASKGSA